MPKLQTGRFFWAGAVLYQDVVHNKFYKDILNQKAIKKKKKND